jgi:hypothetical protein
VPNPIFSLTAGATVDEGNNWVSISWGPLALTAPWRTTNPTLPLGDYGLAAGSPAINYITNANSNTTYAAAPPDDFFGTLRKTNGAVDAGAVEFGGVTAPPVLTSIAPNSGVRSSAVPVTLTGTGFLGASAVTVSGTGVTVSAVTVVNDTTISATFTINATALRTARNVTVVAPGGTSNTVAFTVTGPTLTSIAPSTGFRGSVVPVTLTGTGLSNVTAVAVSGGGITASAVTVVNDTTVTANFTITNGTPLTARNVIVTSTPGGTSNAVTFTVQPRPVPTLTSIAPNSGFRGNAVPVTLTGTGFTGATAVTVAGGGVTVTNRTVVNDTTITATFAINAGTTTTPRNVTVNAPGGTTNAVQFTVGNPPLATVTSITPSTGHRNTNVPVTITGTNFTTAGTTLTGLGSGLSATGVTVVNSTTITATFHITAAAPLSTRSIGVTTPAGNSSNTTPFGVIP